MNEKLGILGRPVRVLIGSRMTTVSLIDYDASDDSYNGAAFVDGTIRVAVIGGTEGVSAKIGGQQFGANEWLLVPTVRVQGLRPYPVKIPGRENEAFQFVYPGEDEQPLIDIANQDVHSTTPEPGTVTEVVEEGNERPPSRPTPEKKPVPHLTDEEQRKSDKRTRKGK